MMRRRACRSSDPKPGKRCKVSPQTKSVKKSAKNEEKVQLDYLIVEKIASLTALKFARGLCHELVSSTFAKALRSFYPKKKLTLSINILYSEDAAVANEDEDDEDDEDDEETDEESLNSEYPHVNVLCVSGFSQQSRAVIEVDDKSLNRIIEDIFVRFSRIHLKVNSDFGDDSVYILSNVLNISRDVALETLEITSEYAVLIDCQGLIEKLSRNLKVLNLRIYDPMDEWSSKWFWQAVASCTELVSLSVLTARSSMMEEEEDSEFDTDHLVMQISDCLKLLKIKRFRTNLQYAEEDIREPTMEWLPGALAKNGNLRELDLNASFESGCPLFLGNLVEVDDGPLVLSRLKSLKIRTSEFDKDCTDWISSFGKILPAISEHAILKVTVKYCKKDIENILRMYLQLSHRTARTIKLRLLFSKDDVDAIARFDRALHHFASMKEFHDLKMITCGAWTRLHFENANVMVKARRHSF